MREPGRCARFEPGERHSVASERGAQIIPLNDNKFAAIDESNVDIGHEATVPKLGEEQLFYLMSRGLSESEASAMIVSGFVEPIVKELPLDALPRLAFTIVARACSARRTRSRQTGVSQESNAR